jgi:hypothetical protein
MKREDVKREASNLFEGSMAKMTRFTFSRFTFSGGFSLFLLIQSVGWCL